TVSKIPVEGLALSLTGTDDKLHIGKTRNVFYEFSPSYASMQDVRYELDGNGLKYIEYFDAATGTIKAKDGISVLDVNSTVTVTAYSIDNPNAFDSVTLTLYMPTTTVKITATTPLGRITDDNRPLAVASSTAGDIVALHTTVNGVESSGLNYVIVKGQEYIENGIILSDGTFYLRPTSNWTNEMKVPHPVIKIRAAYSDGFDEIEISVYIPVETLTFVNSVSTVVENYRSYDMSVEAFPKYATLLADNPEPFVYALSGIDETVAVIDSNGILNLPKSLTSKGSVINYSATLKNEWSGVDVNPLNYRMTVVPVYATAFKSIDIVKDGISIFSNGIKVLPSDNLQVEAEYTIDNVTDIDFTLCVNSNMMSADGKSLSVCALNLIECDNPFIDIIVVYNHGGNIFSEKIYVTVYVPAVFADIDDSVFM
ncbi:MAG: hypothetical protein K2G96_03195, partial [Clostridia bacterium]|nr:hypothetical protein [Clostridia bacterium]